MDKSNYKNNLESFLDKIKGAFVLELGFDIDYNPTFNKINIPFEFYYCHSITIITDQITFDIKTSMTEAALETFWITTSPADKKNKTKLEINSRLNAIEYSECLDSYAFKIRLELENKSIYIYCGEIYNGENSILNYKINDEMILVFEKQKDAETFERLATKS